jgi:uncharacterized protein
MLGEYAPITPDVKRKILGLNAAKLYDLEVPAELDTVGAATTSTAVGSDRVSSL